MYKRDAIYQTKNITPGINTKKFIVLHHTGVIGTTGNLSTLLGKTARPASAHVLVAKDGKAYKLADPDQITRHAGESFWGDLKLLNRYSIGIEVEGIDDFSDNQFYKVIDIIQYLQKIYNIPKENILTHASICWNGAKQKRLRDGKSPSRKTDIHRNFWAKRDIPSFEEFRNQFFSGNH